MTNMINQLIEASTESFDINQQGLGETTVLFCNPHTLVTLTIQECLKLIQEEKQEIENMKVFSTEDKMGQEDLFLKSISTNVIGKIDWIGEDGETWSTVFMGDTVIDSEPTMKLLS